MPGGEFVLHLIPDTRSNNRLMITRHIVLGHFTLVDFHTFG